MSKIKSWPSKKTSSAPQAVAMSTSGFVVSRAGGSISIWDAHPQFASSKYLCDSIFTIEDTFKLPRLKGEDLQHGDITLIYHSITMYPKDNTGAMGLSFGLYRAVLMGRPT
ncbi:hypothetical protein V8D89_002386 [Ganoderma adspersum]